MSMSWLSDNFWGSERRQAHNEKKGRCWLGDVVWYSSPYDYRLVRMLLCAPLAIGVSYGLYYFALSRLELGAWNPLYTTLLNGLIVSIMSCAFMWSPVFRATCLVAICAALSKQGQTLLTILISQQIMAATGPVHNLVLNIEMASESVLCHMDLVADVGEQRARMKMEPVKQLLIGTAKGGRSAKKMVRVADKVFEPLNNQMIRGKIQQEQEAIDKNLTIDGDVRGPTTPKPAPKHTRKFKSKGAAFFHEHLNFNCEDIHLKARTQCQANKQAVKRKCDIEYNKKPCFRMIKDNDCDNIDRRRPCAMFSDQATKKQLCDQSKLDEAIYNQDMDDLMADIEGGTESIDKDAKMGVHFKTVRVPRLLELNSIANLRHRLKGKMSWLKHTFVIIRSMLSALLVFMVYRSFTLAFAYVQNALTNISFENHFIEGYFQRIDERRAERGQLTILPLRQMEKAKHKLRSKFSGPDDLEMAFVKKALFRWMIISVVVISLVALDYYFVSMISMLVKYGVTRGRQVASSNIELSVQGTGFVADMVRNALPTMNRTDSIDRQFNSSHCLHEANKQPIGHYMLNLGLPLLAMLITQVLLSFVVLRARLFLIVMFIFRQRHKSRVLHLYNRLVRSRTEFDRTARSRVRFMARRNIIKPYDDGGFIGKMLKFLRLRKQKCTLCQEVVRVQKIECCEICRTPYCSVCWEDVNRLCYACAAASGAVNSLKSRMVLPTIVEESNESMQQSTTQSTNLQTLTTTSGTAHTQQPSQTVVKL